MTCYVYSAGPLGGVMGMLVGTIRVSVAKTGSGKGTVPYASTAARETHPVWFPQARKKE